ncbi:MAG: MoaD/ThiS family protein [Actinobacteria bacterium]|nr:MAG: MoaD/ThiS family protein [Actinomycetota bacterium]
MSVLVRIPTPLQSVTKGEKEVDTNSGLLKDIINSLEDKYPGLKERLIDESGELRRFVNIYINEEDVRFLNGLETNVAEGAEVSIIPAVAGG